MKPDFKQYIATEITAALIGGAMSAATAIGGTAMRNAAQKRENELAFEREKQQIKEQNAYNSPSAQMARMAAAGLNPNLMYQQGEQGLQTDTAHYTPAELESGVEPLGNIGQQVISDLVGIKDMENKTELAKSQLIVNAATVDFTNENMRLTEAQKNRILDLLEWEVSEKQTNIKLNEKEVEKKGAEINRLVADKNLLIEQKGLTAAEARKVRDEDAVILAELPHKEEFIKMSVEEKRAAVERAAAEIKFMKDKIKVDVANCITNGVVGVAGVAAKFFGKGASLGEVFGGNPWEIYKGQTKGGATTGAPSSGFYGIGDEGSSFLPGD